MTCDGPSLKTWSFSSKKKDLMKLALIATGRWASVGPGFAQVSEPGAWLSPLKLDRSPLGAPSPKISLERSIKVLTTLIPSEGSEGKICPLPLSPSFR